MRNFSIFAARTAAITLYYIIKKHHIQQQLKTNFIIGERLVLSNNIKSSRMARDAFILLPAKIIEGLITMATTAVYTRIFSTAAYGDYQMAHTNMLFLSLILTGWLLNSSARYIGDAEDRDGKRAFFSTMGICFLTVTVAAVLISVGSYFVVKDPLYIATALILFSYSMFQILNSMLIPIGKAPQSAVLSVSAAAVKLFGAYALARVFPGGGGTAYPALIAVFAADLAASIAAIIVLKIPSSFSIFGFSRKSFNNFAVFGLPLVGFSISSSLLSLADKYMVDFRFGKEAFAVYSANNSISTGVFSLLMVGIMRGVYPSVLDSWREGKEKSAVPVISRGARLYMILAMPAAAGLFAVGARLSEVFFDKPEYHIGIIIGIAAVSMFFMGLTEYVNKAWELTSDTMPILYNSLVSAAVKVAASWILLSQLGVVGAAVGSLIAYIFYFVFSYMRARSKFVFALSPLSIFRTVLSSVLCGAAAYFSLWLTGGIKSLVIAVVAGAAVYFLSMLATGEIREELVFVRDYLRAVTKKHEVRARCQ